MSKKLITACLGLLALAAFALPSVASAATPELTEPTGTALAAGSKVTGTLVNGNSVLWNTEKNQVLLECTTATMTGEVTKNAGGVVEANISKAEFGGTALPSEAGAPPECTGIVNASITTLVLPWCLKSTGATFSVRGGKCSEAAKNIKFAMVTTNIGTCEYEATGAIVGSYKTDNVNEDAVLSVAATNPSTANNGFKKIAGSILCPASGQLELAFTLETDETTAKPIYIS